MTEKSYKKVDEAQINGKSGRKMIVISTLNNPPMLSLQYQNEMKPTALVKIKVAMSQ